MRSFFPEHPTISSLNPIIKERIFELGNDPRVSCLMQALSGHSDLFLVGGALRNALLGEKASDLDFSISLHPERVLELLLSKGIHTVATALKHLTLTALPTDNLPAVEITCFRIPINIGQSDLALSKDIQTDLGFRDFTMNALALNLNTGELVDPYNGQLDLNMKLVRAVGNAHDRFGEDPLRIMRLVRFLCEPGFHCESSTMISARMLAPQLCQVSIERVRDELTRISLSPHPSVGFHLLYELGILEMFLPEVAAFWGFEQNRYHKANLFDHTMEVMERLEPEVLLRWSALLHDVGKPATLTIDPESGERHFYYHETVGTELTEKILTRLRFSHQFIRSVQVLVRTHMRPLDAGPGGLRRLIRDTGDHFVDWRKLKEADALACKVDADTVQQQLSRFDQEVTRIFSEPTVCPLKSLAVNGRDILGLGVREGPTVGMLLRALHELVLDNPELNEREHLLAKARSLLDNKDFYDSNRENT